MRTRMRTSMRTDCGRAHKHAHQRRAVHLESKLDNVRVQSIYLLTQSRKKKEKLSEQKKKEK